MIEFNLIANENLERELGGNPDRGLLDRTLVGFEVRDGRDRLMILGLVPPCAISPFTYLWAVIFQSPSAGQLRQMRKTVDRLEGFEWQTLLAEVCNPISERFVKFMGFTFSRDLGDRKLYERRF